MRSPYLRLIPHQLGADRFLQLDRGTWHAGLFEQPADFSFCPEDVGRPIVDGKLPFRWMELAAEFLGFTIRQFVCARIQHQMGYLFCIIPSLTNVSDIRGRVWQMRLRT